MSRTTAISDNDRVLLATPGYNTMMQTVSAASLLAWIADNSATFGTPPLPFPYAYNTHIQNLPTEQSLSGDTLFVIYSPEQASALQIAFDDVTPDMDFVVYREGDREPRRASAILFGVV